MHSCHGVVPVLLINAAEIPARRGQYFRDLVALVTRFITEQFEEHVNSLQALFTQVPPGKTADDLWFQLAEFKAELVEPRARAFLERLLTLLDKHKEDLILRPAEGSPDVMKLILSQAVPIMDVKQVFGSPLSDNDHFKLSAACKITIQQVKESLRILDFAALRRDLDMMKVLADTSKLPMVKEIYHDGVRYLLDDFRGRLSAAFRNLEANNFGPTREHLDDINEELLLHMDELERDEAMNPQYASIRQRREDITHSINSKAEAYTISSLPELGSDEFVPVGSSLTLLQQLIKVLPQYLFQESVEAYQKSVRVVMDRLAEYKVQAVNFIQDCLLGQAHLESGAQHMLTLSCCLDLLQEAATSAVHEHMLPEHKSYYPDVCILLEQQAWFQHRGFSTKLETLRVSEDVCVLDWVCQLKDQWSMLQQVHITFGAHVSKEVQNLHLQVCERLLEVETQLSRGIGQSLTHHDYRAVARGLRELDVITQLLLGMARQRFWDQTITVSAHVNRLVSDLQQEIPQESVPSTSDVFERVSTHLDWMKAAVACGLEQYREVQERDEGCVADSESTAGHKPQVELASKYKSIIADFQRRFEVLAEDFKENLEADNCQILDRCVSFADQLWPLCRHVELMDKECPVLAGLLQRHIMGICEHVASMADPASTSFEPGKLSDRFCKMEGYVHLLDIHSEGTLVSQMMPTMHEKSLADVLQDAQRTAAQNIEIRLSAVEESINAKIMAGQFTSLATELTLLEAMSECLGLRMQQRPQQVLKRVIATVEQSLSEYEIKFQALLSAENLEEAEHTIGVIQQIALLRDFVPRVEQVLNVLQGQLRSRKDAFVQRVESALHGRLYNELSSIMHGARQQLRKGTVDETKQWTAAILLVAAEFRRQCEDAQQILCAAMTSTPFTLNTHKFKRVVEVARTFETLRTNNSDGFCLAELLPDFEAWDKSIQTDCSNLMHMSETAARRALTKYHFHSVPQMQNNLQVLSDVPSVTQTCRETLAKIAEAFSQKRMHLSTELAAMISFGYEPTDANERCAQDPLECTCSNCEFKCKVQPRSIDDLLNGVKKAVDAFPEIDLDDDYNSLLEDLEVSAVALYKSLKVLVHRGEMDGAMLLMTNASKLQSSANTKSYTICNEQWHAKHMEDATSLKESFLSKRHARQDPDGFNQRFNSIKQSDFALYTRKLEPLRTELIDVSTKLGYEIKQLALGDEQKMEAVIMQLEEQYVFTLGVKDHFASELRFPELLQTLETKLKGMLEQLRRAQKTGHDMHEVESGSRFFQFTIEKLQHSRVQPMVTW
ncbi:unnamed protein product [Polarella glacialis]|uniref:Uncharacterized protein n=1 Tax=Polarella glacialis TaxID=89957 RepID=A0A813F3Q6_POLGL|nr:unnamed protein product [Polarella glacialis]